MRQSYRGDIETYLFFLSIETFITKPFPFQFIHFVVFHRWFHTAKMKGIRASLAAEELARTVAGITEIMVLLTKGYVRSLIIFYHAYFLSHYPCIKIFDSEVGLCFRCLSAARPKVRARKFGEKE
jgi:hypothetical protein